MNYHFMKSLKLLIIFFLALTCFSSCKKYLDIVPDNIATLDNAFTMRTQAQKFLFTCYSYMPREGDWNDNPALLAGDELWAWDGRSGFLSIAKGQQATVGPLGDRWAPYYQGLRDCNIFLENIGKVPDMKEEEKKRWTAEVKFLKAYYHFCLVRMYGPVPLIKENLPIDADVNKVKVYRNTLDDCFAYIVELLNEATADLPDRITNPAQEAGRITKVISLAFKAKVFVFAASPLFNGNADQNGLKNNNGQQLFNTSYVKEKWDSAVNACKAAIDFCEQQGMKLYYYNPDFQQYNLTDTIVTQLSIRNAITQKWNAEIIWANTQSYTDNLQAYMTTWWDPTKLDGVVTRGEFSPPLKIAEMFYTDKGVPIDEDKSWNYSGRYTLKVGGKGDELYIRNGYTTASLNFGREPRFYADMAFDGSVFYGQGRYDDSKPSDLFYLEGKFKQRNGYGKQGINTATGYYVKKLIHFQNVIGEGNNYSISAYAWILIRLSDLYLMYAEALNEAQGPTAEAYDYINRVRKRAGLSSVQEAWSTWSINPVKYQTKEGLREIIHRERLIELAFEGQRFWDLRRWKEAVKELNKPIVSWDLKQETAQSYYRNLVIFNQTFGTKDYFWPIDVRNIEVNPNLVQNTGW